MQHDWPALRELIARQPKTINLNAGTVSPTPLSILEAVTELRRRQAGNPSDFIWRQAPPLTRAGRAALAEYLNCLPAQLVLLPNITFAMNIIVSSLGPQLPTGSEILTTDHEYGAMMNCW